MVVPLAVATGPEAKEDWAGEDGSVGNADRFGGRAEEDGLGGPVEGEETGEAEVEVRAGRLSGEEREGKVDRRSLSTCGVRAVGFEVEFSDDDVEAGLSLVAAVLPESVLPLSLSPSFSLSRSSSLESDDADAPSPSLSPSLVGLTLLKAKLPNAPPPPILGLPSLGLPLWLSLPPPLGRRGGVPGRERVGRGTVPEFEERAREAKVASWEEERECWRVKGAKGGRSPE